MDNSKMCAYYREVRVNKDLCPIDTLALSFLKASERKAGMKELAQLLD